jgi:hypothetical protein
MFRRLLTRDELMDINIRAGDAIVLKLRRSKILPCDCTCRMPEGIAACNSDQLIADPACPFHLLRHTLTDGHWNHKPQ